MKFELNDGRIIEAVKDCECCTHEGPHWIHMDELTHRLNTKNIENVKTALGVIGIAIEEEARCREKIYQMTTRGIKRIIYG